MNGSAGKVVGAYLRDQVDQISSRQPGVRAGKPDDVHKSRVATRRLRSVLAAYGRLLHREATDPLRDELRWWAGLLGEVRDTDVLRLRLEGLREDSAIPVAAPLDSALRQAESELEGRRDTALARVWQEMDDERYAAMLAGLESMVDRPPWRGGARRPARRVVPLLVGRACDRVAAAAAAVGDPGSPGRDERLHEVRKAAKRARYSAEVALPLDEDRAAPLVAAMTHLQELLGEHQDAAMARGVLTGLAAHSDSAQSAFGLGALYGQQDAAEAHSEDAYADALQAALADEVRGWTRPPA